MIAGTDIRYAIANPNQHPLTGTFALDPGLHTGIAGITHTARPVLLDLADRADLRDAARGREGRIDIVTADVVDRPADALLIRPDAYIAWAATTGQPGDEDAVALQEALAHWFGEPLPPPL